MAAVLQRRPARAQSTSITSPIGGLNARDSLAAMPPQDAVILTNFFPSTTTVDLRKGSKNWVTGFTSAVETIMPYNSNTAMKVFAAAGTAFYDVTAQGAVGAAVVSGLSNARWQYGNMGTAGGQFLLCVNGADKLQGYNGSAWWVDGDGSHDITGVDTATCIHIDIFKNRVYLIQKDSFSVWYLPESSIAGAASKLDLSSLFKLGGYLMCMMTWTIDNAAGIQDFAAFMSSQGEIALYQGYDPSTVGSWSLVGMFRVGRPIGRRCYEKLGSDVVVITADGFMPLSKALLTDRSQLQLALSDKILNLVNHDVQSYNGNFGWQPVLYPIGNKFIFNVPQTEGTTQYQYVQNTITGAWCKFTNWNANCFAVQQDTLYMGGNLVSGSAAVLKCDTGYSDNGAYIPGEVKTAFNYFGSPGYLKRWTMIRPIFSLLGNVTPAIGLDVDFDDVTPTATATFSPGQGSLWNTSLWNTFLWGNNSLVKRDWQGVNGVGYCAALHMKVNNNTTGMSWMAVDYVFEQGAQL